MFSRPLFRARSLQSKQLGRPRFESTTAPASPPRPSSYADVKKALLGPTFTTRAWYLIALVGAGVALASYYKDRDNTPERALALALSEINNDIDRIKQDGFSILNQALFATKRLFSGPVGLPVGAQHLASQNVIQSLLDNIRSSNPEISSQAALWLLKLSSPEVLPRNYQKVRVLMFQLDPGLQSLAKLLTSDNYAALGGSWAIASQIFVRLSPEELSLVSPTALRQGITSMANSSNPAAATLAASLYQKLSGPQQESLFDVETRSHLNTLVMAQENHPVRVRDVEATSKRLASTRNAVGPTASPWSIIAFSLFAAVWGKTMWYLSLQFNPASYTMTYRLEPSARKEMKMRFLKSRNVGTAVFTLLMFDYLASRYLQDPLYFPDELKSAFGLPPSTLIPVAQTSLLTLGTLIAIKTQRFVVVPLLLAGLYNHWDLVEPWAERYIPEASKTYREGEKKLACARREVASWLADER